MDVVYADPAGNITAIVRENVPFEERIVISQGILNENKAEQVGFESKPVKGGAGRLEMAGGEFCGNATRSYGYLLAKEMMPEEKESGHIRLKVEISGALEPVEVIADLMHEKSYASMPLPLGIRRVEVLDRQYPVVCMEGIDHLIAENVAPSQEFTDKALKAMDADKIDAAGVIYLESNSELTSLTPAVYVHAVDSLVWESSCGSGSVAAAWYLTGKEISLSSDMTADGIRTFIFKEPGGTLEVNVTVERRKIKEMWMGGSIKLR